MGLFSKKKIVHSYDKVMLIRSEADLDNFKKMYGINEKIEKEY